VVYSWYLLFGTT